MQGNNNFNYVPRNQFSSYFKAPVYPPSQEVSTSTNNIVWVQGIEGAKAWQLNPNSMIMLLDSEAEQENIRLKAMDYSVLDIMLEQEEQKEKYINKIKEIGLC